MFTTILLLVIAGGVAFLIFKSQKGPKKLQDPGPKRLYSKTDLRIENVGPGGVIKLSSVGPDMEDFDVSITSKHSYREGGYTWYELEGDRGNEKVWIDVEEDDHLELAVVLKQLKLRDLGISKSDLEKMDDDEEGEFLFENEKFYYEDSDRATFSRHSDKNDSEDFYYWEFENDEGDKYISVEKWSDGSFEASLSVPLKDSQVTVYSIGGSPS